MTTLSPNRLRLSRHDTGICNDSDFSDANVDNGLNYGKALLTSNTEIADGKHFWVNEIYTEIRYSTVPKVVRYRRYGTVGTNIQFEFRLPRTSCPTNACGAIGYDEEKVFR